MKATQKQASKRLFKKLSALRATLSNEERAILDNLMGVNEVKAHQAVKKAAGKATEVKAHKMTGKATEKAAGKTTEVKAHKMTGKAIEKATDKATEVKAHKMTGKATSKATEVKAHKMTGKATEKATDKATEVKAHKLTGKATEKATGEVKSPIVFDPNSEEYKIQE